MFKRSAPSHASRIAKIKALAQAKKNHRVEHLSVNTSKTKIVIKYDVGMNNTLYIRGRGANLSWEKGVALKNIAPDEWAWETDRHFEDCEFKVLINDEKYEMGDNHRLYQGSAVRYTPTFG